MNQICSLRMYLNIEPFSRCPLLQIGRMDIDWEIAQCFANKYHQKFIMISATGWNLFGIFFIRLHRLQEHFVYG